MVKLMNNCVNKKGQSKLPFHLHMQLELQEAEYKITFKNASIKVGPQTN